MDRESNVSARIEAERERTLALLTELLSRFATTPFPRSFRRCPNYEARPGRSGLLASCRSSRSGRARRSSTKAPSSPTMAAAIKRSATPASRLTTKRIGDVSRLLVATPSRSATVARSREIRSTQRYDAVALNGGSFLALHDKPGACPGPGWQLLSAPGKRGVAGDRRAIEVLLALPGRPERTPRAIVGWAMDRAAYTVTPVMSDGSSGPPLNLRGLFEQFVDETGSVTYERFRQSL